MALARLAGALSWRDAIQQLGMSRRWLFLDDYLPRHEAPALMPRRNNRATWPTANLREVNARFVQWLPGSVATALIGWGDGLLAGQEARHG